MALDHAVKTIQRTVIRSTTGQAVAICYDLSTNTLEFVEDDWAAEGFRAGIVPSVVLKQRLPPAGAARLRSARN